MSLSAHTGYIGWGPPCLDPAYRALIAARNPGAWWPMDDSSTTLADISGNGYHAGISGGGSTDQTGYPGPQGLPCSAAINFLGGFYYSGLVVGTTQHYALMTTVRSDILLQDDVALYGAWASGSGMMMYISSADNLRLYHGATFWDVGLALPVGEWTHVLWGWNGSRVKTWINGVPYLDAAATGSQGTPTYGGNIGSYGDRGISVFDGQMQHMVVFLDGDADAILNDTDAALLAAAAMGA